MLQQINKLPLESQHAYRRSCISEEMRSHIKCAIDINEDNIPIEEILDNIQTYLRKKRNVAIDRVSFSERKQEEGESFDFFYVALKQNISRGI